MISLRSAGSPLIDAIQIGARDRNAVALELWNAVNNLAWSKPATRPKERGPAEAGPVAW
jgi:hypothetical protein